MELTSWVKCNSLQNMLFTQSSTNFMGYLQNPQNQQGVVKCNSCDSGKVQAGVTLPASLNLLLTPTLFLHVFTYQSTLKKHSRRVSASFETGLLYVQRVCSTVRKRKFVWEWECLNMNLVFFSTQETLNILMLHDVRYDWDKRQQELI